MSINSTTWLKPSKVKNETWIDLDDLTFQLVVPTPFNLVIYNIESFLQMSKYC